MTASRQTLTDYVDSAWGDDPAYEGLGSVVSAIADGTRIVQEKVQAAAIADVLGATGDVNVQGEVVQILDEQSSDIFVDVLTKSGAVAAVGSEEIAEGVIVGNHDAQRYVVLMDPLDGSSNIDVAVSIGSIFGIWRREPGEDVTAETMLMSRQRADRGGLRRVRFEHGICRCHRRRACRGSPWTCRAARSS